MNGFEKEYTLHVRVSKNEIINYYFLYLLIPSYNGLAINTKNKITVPKASSQSSLIKESITT